VRRGEVEVGGGVRGMFLGSRVGSVKGLRRAACCLRVILGIVTKLQAVMVEGKLFGGR